MPEGRFHSAGSAARTAVRTVQPIPERRKERIEVDFSIILSGLDQILKEAAKVPSVEEMLKLPGTARFALVDGTLHTRLSGKVGEEWTESPATVAVKSIEELRELPLSVKKARMIFEGGTPMHPEKVFEGQVGFGAGIHVVWFTRHENGGGWKLQENRGWGGLIVRDTVRIDEKAIVTYYTYGEHGSVTLGGKQHIVKDLEIAVQGREAPYDRIYVNS